jgi:hypothetical protein
MTKTTAQKVLRDRMLGDFSNRRSARTMMQTLRELDFQGLISSLGISSITEAVTRATEVSHRMLNHYRTMGVSFENFEPAHGRGHLVRDYVNLERVLRNAKAGEINPNEAYIGGIAAILHDTGNAIFDRYLDENKSDLRHAEIGALMFLEQSQHIGFPRDAAMLVAYAIAAHTHYLKPLVVNVDGENIITQPYVDLYPDGSPMRFVWLPRQIDRLDLSNVTHIGRYFLTLCEMHHDYSSTGFYEVNFTKALRASLRSSEEIATASDGKTMLEHSFMLLKSQDNSSAYGKFDHGHYLTVRDQNKALHFEAIHAGFRKVTDRDCQERILQAWEVHLGQNIDSSQKSKAIAKELCEQFRMLDSDTQARMSSVFLSAMLGYRTWLNYVHADLHDLNYNPALESDSMLGDVSDVLEISPEVNRILDEMQGYNDHRG